MKPDLVSIEPSISYNIAQTHEIQRDDISEIFVDTLEAISEFAVSA